MQVTCPYIISNEGTHYCALAAAPVCEHVRSSGEGTHHCALAEDVVQRLTAERDALLAALKQIKHATQFGGGQLYAIAIAAIAAVEGEK